MSDVRFLKINLAWHGVPGYGCYMKTTGYEETHTQFFAVFHNHTFGMRSHVTRGKNGYHVSMRDMDTDQPCGEVIIFPLPDYDKAVAYAATCVAGF